MFCFALRDKFSIWRQNSFYWLLMARQVLAFYDMRSITDGATEIFFALKLLLLYVMITAYHSHFGIPNELVRIIIIMKVYFWVGVAICFKLENNNIEFTQLLKKHFAIILTFTIISFFINFLITLIIRFFQEELVKYLNSKIEQQEMFESILYNLEERIISIDD